MPGERPNVKLAADANVLLSVVLGGRAGLIATHPNIGSIFTTEQTFAEVEEYAPLLSRKRGLPLNSVLLAVAALPISIVGREIYERSMARAKRLMGRRDPEDVELLALALHMKIPVWSNDNDFQVTGVEWYTTAQLLRTLGISRL